MNTTRNINATKRVETFVTFIVKIVPQEDTFLRMKLKFSTVMRSQKRIVCAAKNTKEIIDMSFRGKKF